MTAPAEDFTVIDDGNFAAGQPVFGDDGLDMNNNSLHLKDVLYGGFTPTKGHNHDGANSALVSSVANNAIGQAQISSGAVHQSELNTSVSTVSVTTGTVHLYPSCGSYGFYPNFRVASNQANDASASFLDTSDAGSNIGTTSRPIIAMTLQPSSGQALYAAFRYVNSSPPYELAGRIWGLFLQELRDKETGEIIASFLAPDPVWAGDWSHLPKNHPGRIIQFPHPFAGYYKKELPPNLEIILIDLAALNVEESIAEETLKLARLKAQAPEFLAMGISATEIERFEREQQAKSDIETQQIIQTESKINDLTLRKSALIEEDRDTTLEEKMVDKEVAALKPLTKKKPKWKIIEREKELLGKSLLQAINEGDVPEAFECDTDIDKDELELLPQAFRDRVRVVRK